MIFNFLSKLWMTAVNKFDANWHVPSNVKAFTTLRYAGFSSYPFHENNLATHVGDKITDVHLNREQLSLAFHLPKTPAWLEQTHSNCCITLEETDTRTADASVTRLADQPLALLTADCLPILLCNTQGNEIAAIHAGWRGLVDGVIENTVERMHSPLNTIIAWIGPAICHSCFEVGEELWLLYQKKYPFALKGFYQKEKKWHANLALLAEYILHNLGILNVFQSNACTFEQKNNFYSYRRETQTGRMATIIWFTQGKKYD